MTVAARLNGRLTALAATRHLPHRTARVRLTLLYGGLFLLSGAALMAIAYALLVNAGFVFTLGPTSGGSTQPGLVSTPWPGGLPIPGTKTHPSAQTIAHWRAVARCMRQHGVAGFPVPTSSTPRAGSFYGVISDHDGAILAIPATINSQSAAYKQAAGACGLIDAYQKKLYAENTQGRTDARQQLLIQSAIALGAMSLLSVGLGWILAGRVLRPLEDSHRAQRQFVANASHELRAPLTRLRAISEVALSSPDASDASLRAAHERVIASEENLEQLIDGLLALTRGHAGLERRERVDLRALTTHAILAHQCRLTDRDLDLRTTLEPANTPGDPRLLERLVDNLIDNAIRHNVAGGRLDISTGTRDKRPFLSITNTSPPIPPDQLERLFEPFQRLAERTGHHNGHGLGLAIVQAIATAHQATLHAHLTPGGGLAIEIAFLSASDTRPKTASITHPSKATSEPPSQDNRAGRDPARERGGPRRTIKPWSDRDPAKKAPGPGAAPTDQTRE
jgi:signal transduction histidine kinase